MDIVSQIKFERGNKIYRENKIHFSGMATGISDLNGDLYDDLIVLNKSKFLEIGYNQGPNKQFIWLPSVKAHTAEEYSMVIGDYDNDGSAEITTGGTFSGSKIFKFNGSGNGLYAKQQDIQPLIYTQAANVIDFNNDGYLDYFACHDEGANLMLQNDKFGNLQPVDIIDFSTIPVSDKSGNYGSEWCDIDNDGDLDLYIAKCKFGVTDREDPRRHNMLYINKGNGTFANEAEIRGLKIKGQSWTGSFADIDNDGDMDCIVTNHDEPHLLLKNDGQGFFSPTDVVLPQTFAFQSLWSDLDNDGFIDLLITGADFTFIYKNIDGKDFQRIDGTFGPSIINSASLGDINDDGFVDVNAVYGININYPGSIKDELFINQKNDNHYLKFSLVGRSSNKMGIGARISLFGLWGIQSREVQSGVSYGISNSLNQIFGLGKNTFADSIIIKWPSGIVDKYYNITADQSFTIHEGKCMSKRFAINSPKDIICDNESIPLSTVKNFTKYKWSNGVSEKINLAEKEGLYYLIATDENGCDNYSFIKYIEQPPRSNEIIVPAIDTLYFCDEVSLNVVNGLSDIKWDNSIFNANYTARESKSVSVSAKDLCNEVHTDLIYVNKLEADMVITNDTVAKGGNALLKASGQKVQWFTDVDKNNFIYEGNELNVINVQATTKYFVQNTASVVRKFTIGEVDLPTGSNVYPADNNDLGLYLNVYKDITIKSCEVSSDKAGFRRFLLINYAGDTVGRKDVYVAASEKQLITLNFKASPGALYQLKTDDNINIKNFGHKAPRLKRLAEGSTYPYEVYGVAEIPTSIRGGSGYYYFFNIMFADEGTKCESEVQEVIAYLDIDLATDGIENQILLYPNPTNGTIQLNLTEKTKINVFNEIGLLVFSTELNSGINELFVPNLIDGLYNFKLTTHNKTYHKKIMIVK